MNEVEKVLENILTAVDRVVESSDQLKIETSIDTANSDVLKDVRGVHDQEEMYNLFYKGIQRILSEYLPKGEDITKIIRNLNATILSKHMKNEYGVRGGDSRQASVNDYKNLIDAYEKWYSVNPENLLGLAYELLKKGKELEIIPDEMEISDFLK